jgi:hypothetical protein
MKENVHDKITHLVEVDDDIFAVFTIDLSRQIIDVYIAKNTHIDMNYIKRVFNKIEKINLKDERIDTDPKENEDKDFLGNLKWDVMEFEKIRILEIYEKIKTIVVLIKSHTQLEDTVDNILGYYYEGEGEDLPKILF